MTIELGKQDLETIEIALINLLKSMSQHDNQYISEEQKETRKQNIKTASELLDRIIKHVDILSGM